MRSKPFSRNSAFSPPPARQSYKRTGSPVRYLAIVLCLASAFGCAPKKPPEPKPSVTQAQRLFMQKCRDEFDLHVITRMAGQTLWIYLPIRDPIFDYEAQKEGSADAGEHSKPSKFLLPYLDGNFKNGRFSFEYDVVPVKKSKSEDYGYSSSYTDNYVKIQNNIFTAINDSFFNMQPNPGEKEPEFFVIVITDIKKGIETRATFYLEDFKRYMSGDLPYEEYMKRFLADTKGGESLIGDETGSHLKYKEVTMPEFLTKQIINRINFKFQRSDFPPSDDYDNTIVGIVADTTRYYHFTQFDSLQLSNLRKNKKFLFERNQLASFGADATNTSSSGGRLIHIRFENGQAQINDQ